MTTTTETRYRVTLNIHRSNSLNIKQLHALQQELAHEFGDNPGAEVLGNVFIGELPESSLDFVEEFFCVSPVSRLKFFDEVLAVKFLKWYREIWYAYALDSSTHLARNPYRMSLLVELYTGHIVTMTSIRQ